MRFLRRTRVEATPDPMPAVADVEPVGEQPYARHDCPYCAAPLDPLPKAKKRCPACRQPIYVRSGPDGIRYLLREADLEAHEARWGAIYAARSDEEAKQHNIDAAASTEAALRSYRDLGVNEVELLSSDDACPACAAATRVWLIKDAPPIPIPGCSNEICRCDYAPVV